MNIVECEEETECYIEEKMNKQNMMNKMNKEEKWSSKKIKQLVAKLKEEWRRNE